MGDRRGARRRLRRSDQGVEPVFLAAPSSLFLVGRRWRELGSFALAAAPALGALALWKYRGYGTLPAFGNGLRAAASSRSDPVDARLDLHAVPQVRRARLVASPEQPRRARRGVLQPAACSSSCPFAGAIAVRAAFAPLALALSVWFWLYFLIKGSDAVSSVDSASFFRLLLPAIPPLVVMVACAAGPRPAARPGAGDPVSGTRDPSSRAPDDRRRRGRRSASAAGPRRRAQAGPRPEEGADHEPDRGAGRRRHRPRGASRGRRRALDVARAKAGLDPRLLPRAQVRGTEDTLCQGKGGADKCGYAGFRRLRTRQTVAVDRPGPGTWSYRIGVGANWIDDPLLGDVFLVSGQAIARVP